MVNQINWNKQLKISIRESTISQAKHLVVKSLICLLIRIKYASILRYQRIYTELEMDEVIPDIYHENLKTKSIVCYEIQDKVSSDYITLKNTQYNEKEIYGFKLDWQLIDLNKLSNDLDELVSQLKELII